MCRDGAWEWCWIHPHIEAGRHPIALRGATPLAAGVYFYRVQAPEGVVRGRFVVLE